MAEPIEDLLRNIVRTEVEAVIGERGRDIEAGLLNAATAAAYLSMGRSTLMRRRDIPSRMVDNRRYWARADLDAWIASLPATRRPRVA